MDLHVRGPAFQRRASVLQGVSRPEAEWGAFEKGKMFVSRTVIGIRLMKLRAEIKNNENEVDL